MLAPRGPFHRGQFGGGYVAPPGTLPGQASNRVGYTSAPGYPGSLTSHAPTGFVSGSVGTPNVYSFLDIDAGAGGTAFNAGLDYVTFVGCRFQSNAVGSYNVQVNGATNIIFNYCSFTPRVALAPSPPGAAWPSASAGANTIVPVSGVNCIPAANGYQYGLNIVAGGPVTAQHCDFWGGVNDVVFYSTTAQMLIDNCWLHDNRNANDLTDHSDGAGYLNGATAPQNVTVSNCTIASLGTGNALGFQGATTTFTNNQLIGNYVSGYGYNCMFFVTAISSCPVTDNTFASDIQWAFGPIYSDPTALFTASSSTWRRNKFKFYPGTVPASGAWAFTSADNGKFMFPNSTLSVTDFTG